MTAQRGDFERPSPAPVPAAARDTWRDQMVAALTAHDSPTYWGWAKGYLDPEEISDAVLPVLVAAQREAAAAEITDRVRVIRALADEATSEAEQVALDDVVARLRARASALRAGGETT